MQCFYVSLGLLLSNEFPHGDKQKKKKKYSIVYMHTHMLRKTHMHGYSKEYMTTSVTWLFVRDP